MSLVTPEEQLYAKFLGALAFSGRFDRIEVELLDGLPGRGHDVRAGAG